MSAVQTEVRRQTSEDTIPQARERLRRKGARAYLILAAVTVLGLAGYFGYGWLKGGQVTTDNAQIEADVVPLASKVGGVVLHLHVKDNQDVKEDDLIAEIDPRDYEIRLAQAEADLEAAKAQAETSAPPAGAPADAAQVAAAEAALARADTDLRRVESDLARSRKLKAQNAITAVEFENAQSAVENARATREQARAQLQLAEEQHGFAAAKVKSFQAALDQARAQLEYTKIHAPRAGTLSKIAVQEGQLVQPGQTLAQLVGDDAYVIANFKETQIGQMRPGQHAELTVDAYPGRHFEGRVESLAAATGARFSLLPPDNASGNFVKVVQRVPVKIRLDKPADAAVSLKAGLSADVTIYLK
jgi:membrane fusion protein (multidrug efflux system)